ncbi:4789_t:CDS:2 [Diversispora eburnea]|uniref:4789_t:CDS:1 n=1 Tax=Diversispora eburnea TaxID=1213867 RepID=A0A9N9CGG9_9GLOM|nr:4789_t:CDS:2 [Diversispora eburnea]
MSSIERRRAQDSGYDVWPDIYDFLFYNILPLIILLVYGPEKKPWFGKIIYYIDDLIILFCLCALPLIIIKTSVPEMDTKDYEDNADDKDHEDNADDKDYEDNADDKDYEDNADYKDGKEQSDSKLYLRITQIVGLLNFAFLIIYQSLWFNICFPTSPAVTKSIFGITLLSVGRILYYMANEDSGDHVEESKIVVEGENVGSDKEPIENIVQIYVQENYNEPLKQRQRDHLHQYRIHQNMQTINSTRNFFEFAHFKRFQLSAVTFYKMCEAKKFTRELSSIYCANGKVTLAKVDIPENLNDLFLRNDKTRIEF